LPYRIFREVDSTKSGALNLESFVTAYQIIYTRPYQPLKNDITKRSVKKPNEFICALRYGIGLKAEYIYQLHLGSVTEIDGRNEITFDEKRTYNIGNGKQVGDCEYTLDPGWKIHSLEQLNDLITRDANNNKYGIGKVYWWVDIAMTKVASHRIDKYIGSFGLPNDSKFRSNFGQFGVCLPKEEKSRIYAGNGVSKIGGVSSLNFFVQSLWIMNTPITHHIPAWLENLIETYSTPETKKQIMKYYFSRFAFFWNASSLTSSNSIEYAHAFENAQNIANVSIVIYY
jgi:hypothetical protein